MNELSLFTGAGGGVLGSKLLGWETIGYVEWDTYCQKVIAARIADGHLPVAPIFGDVREFVLSGAAAEYRGVADVVSGGFPCQPFSVAGRRAGADDSRNMWPATIDVIRAVRPRFAFLENVPGLLASGYFGTIVGDLAESGYDARWRILSAAELGAPHKRDRLWIMADAFERTRQPSFTRTGKRTLSCSDEAGDGEVAHAPGARNDRRTEGHEAGERRRQSGDRHLEANAAHPNGAGRGEQWRAVAGGEELAASQLNRWWEVEPNVGRVVDGVAARVDRLRAIGNGQVPIVAATAWLRLTGDL